MGFYLFIFKTMAFKNRQLRNQQIQKEQKYLILLQDKIRKQISNIDDTINELKVEALQLSTVQALNTEDESSEKVATFGVNLVDQPSTSSSLPHSTQILQLGSQQVEELQLSEINHQALDLDVPIRGNCMIEEEDSDTN